MKILSQIHAGAEIPRKYTCEGEDVNPSLAFEDVPEDAKSVAIILDDPDSVAGTWVHWLIWNLDPEKPIEEDSVPRDALQGTNDFGDTGYGGPCPGRGRHRYFFTAYALDNVLELEEGAGRMELEEFMRGHILCEAKLMGTYEGKTK